MGGFVPGFPPIDTGTTEATDFCTLAPEFCGGTSAGEYNPSPVPTPVSTAAPVTINNLIDISQQSIGALADAVSSAIASAAQKAADIAKSAADAISQSVETLAQKIWDGVQAALGAVADVVKSLVGNIGSFLASVFQSLYDHIGDLLSAVQNVVVPLIQKVADVVESISQEVQTINDTLIQPIANAINTTISTVSTLTVAIEKDLHDGLSGLLAIPTDIANGLGSLDATLQRTVEQLGSANQTAIGIGISTGTKDTVQTPLESIGKTLTMPAAVPPVSTTFTDHVSLTEPAGLSKVDAALTALISKLGISQTTGQFSLGEAFQATLDGYKDSPGLFQWAVRGLVDVAMFLTEIAAIAGPLESYAGEVANKVLPVAKLPAADTVEAWQRGLIADADLHEELLRQGFNDSRQQVMKDLSVNLVDVAQAGRWYRRGFITLDDFKANMKEHGYDDGQIAANIEDLDRIFPVEQAITLWRRGLIDTNALSGILQQNFYSESEIEAALATFEALPDVAQQMSGDLFRILFGQLNFTATANSEPPDQLTTAAKRMGWADANLQQYWWSHWNVPPVQHWISLYFRGVRTKTELYAAMDAFAIPVEIRDDLILAQRPLIPYRSIPSMLKAGILSEEQAKQALQSHGFDEATVLQLIEFASASAKTSSAATATALHALSLTTASELFRDGAITEAQYTQILTEHGLSADAAALTIQAEKIKDTAASRKATALEIVDEASAGLITPEAAQQQLAQANFTIAEQAKYIRAIRSAKIKTSKIPSEADLNHFLQKSIIMASDYVAAMQQAGYSLDWANKFLAWRTAAPESAGAAP